MRECEPRRLETVIERAPTLNSELGFRVGARSMQVSVLVNTFSLDKSKAPDKSRTWI